MSENQSIAGRIIEYREIKGFHKKEFERICGLSNAYLDNTKSPGIKILERILDKCKDLDRSWVITGKGEMIIENNGEKKNHDDILKKEEIHKVDCEELVNKLKEREVLDQLRKEIVFLREIIDSKSQTIKALEETIITFKKMGHLAVGEQTQ